MNSSRKIAELLLTLTCLVCLGTCAAGAVWMEAVGHWAAPEAGAGGLSCTALQRPAAEGGRHVHPHICCSHERSHNEPHAAQPGTSGYPSGHISYHFTMRAVSSSLSCVLQRSRHLQRVVRRCALRWKQRALCKPQREKAAIEQPRKKSVTFCLSTRGPERVSTSESVEQEAEDVELSKLWVWVSDTENLGSTHEHVSQFLFLNRLPTNVTRRLESNALVSSTQPSPKTEGSEDLLLPPSAFMNTGSQTMVMITGWFGQISIQIHCLIEKR